MYVDIVIFAIITLFLVLKLKSVLGVKNSDDGDEPHIIIKTTLEENLGKVLELNTKAVLFNSEIDKVSKEIDEKFLRGDVSEIKTGISDIFEVDNNFDVEEFVEGAKSAFEMIVTAYGKGNREELKPLLSQKLYEGFEKAIIKREENNRTEETVINKIDAFISNASLKGTMAYITVDFDVEKNVTVKENGEVVSDKDDSISSSDIWTFTRDTRSDDPNWILIETKAS